MTRHAHRVAVTGLGVVCALGRDVDGVFQALMDGRSAIGMHSVGAEPFSVTIPSAICSSVEGAMMLGRSRVTALDRVSHLSVVASAAAWDDAGLGALTDIERERACVLMGTAVGGAQSVEHGYRELFVRNRPRVSPLTVVQCMNNAPAAHVAQQHGLGGTCFTYSIACASGAAAIADGARRVRTGECELALVGAAEASLPFGIVKAWQSMRVLASAQDADGARHACRPFSEDRDGMVLGEGAAVLVLEAFGRAKARGARIYAEIAGVGSSCDPGHITSTATAGQVRAIDAAIRDADANPEEVAYINAHGTALSEGDPVEIDALRRYFGQHASKMAVSSTKSMHGHMLGASGAVEAAITALAVSRRSVPPTANVTRIDPACHGVDHVLGSGRSLSKLPLALSDCFAFGGSNVVLAFRAA